MYRKFNGGNMPVFLLLIVLAAFRFRQNTLFARKSLEEKEGVFLDCDMSAKLRELLDDPSMNDQKWREWLPLFEAADLQVRRKCPHLALGRNAEFVKKIIDPDYSPTF